MKIPILIENVSPDDLLDKLKTSDSEIEFDLVDDTEDNRGADPVIVAALISGGVASFSLLINTIVLIWKTCYEKDNNKGTFIIKDKEGNSIEFPVDTPKHEREELIENAKKMSIDFMGVREDVKR